MQSMKSNTENKINELNKSIGNRKNIFGQVLVDNERLYTETTSHLYAQKSSSQCSYAAIPANSKINSSINNFMRNVNKINNKRSSPDRPSTSKEIT